MHMHKYASGSEEGRREGGMGDNEREGEMWGGLQVAVAAVAEWHAAPRCHTKSD